MEKDVEVLSYSEVCKELSNMGFKGKKIDSVKKDGMVLECLAKTGDCNKYLLKLYLELEDLNKKSFVGRFYCSFRVSGKMFEVKGFDKIVKSKIGSILYLVRDVLKNKEYVVENSKVKFFSSGLEVYDYDDESILDFKGFVKKNKIDKVVEVSEKERVLLSGRFVL